MGLKPQLTILKTLKPYKTQNSLLRDFRDSSNMEKKATDSQNHRDYFIYVVLQENKVRTQTSVIHSH